MQKTLKIFITKPLKYILRAQKGERVFPNACCKIRPCRLPEIFGNWGDSSISYLDNHAENKCCELWKARGAQGWDQKAEGREGHFVGFIVSQDCILFPTPKEHIVLGFLQQAGYCLSPFSTRYYQVYLEFFVLLLIGSSSKVQSTICRCYRDTKVQDKVLPTTGRLF